MAYCKTCKRTKNDSEFYVYKKSGKPRGICKLCHTERYKAYMENPAKHKRKADLQKKWYQENKEYAKQLSKDWYERPENYKRTRISQNESNRIRRLNPIVKERKDKQKEASINRRKNDPLYILNHRIWAANGNHRRRARMLRAVENTEVLTNVQWQEICNQYGNKCLCCNRTDRPLTIDHIVPVTKGGKHTASNVQPLCQSCNTRKKQQTIDYRK